MLSSQGRFKIVNEPFNLRQAVVRDNLKLDTWESLFQAANRPLIRSYIQSFVDGRDTDFRFKRESPFNRAWHPWTDRIIFKILFAGEDYIDWFETEFGGNIILLLRHPIPVALSREEFPRLESLLSPPYALHFSAEQIAYARALIATHDRLQIAVLDWCLQNSVPLRQARSSWTVLSYEEMVLHPRETVNYLAGRYGLPNEDKMLRRVFEASGSTGKSKADSHSVLSDPQEIRHKRSWLVNRWKEKVAPDAVSHAFRTLRVYGIDFYESHRTLPAHKYLLSGPK